MIGLDFIGWLDNYCKENGILFCPNEAAYSNIISDSVSCKPDSLILCCDLSLSPVFGDMGVQSVTYIGNISLGRKKEECTESNLSEMFMEKYNARLKDLLHILMQFFERLGCEEGVTIDNLNVYYMINSFDLNADFVQAQIQMSVGYEEVE